MKYNPKVVLAYFKECGLPAPITEHEFAISEVYEDKAGHLRNRRWRFDFAWPDRRVALEVEGGAFSFGAHTRGAGFVKDIKKYNTAVMLGWRVVRCVPSELCMASTVTMLKKLLCT